MDLKICSILSLIETVGLVGVKNLGSLGAVEALPTFLAYLIAQYATIKFFRIFIYPFYFSPLRGLPGPKDGHIFFGQSIKQIKADSPLSLFFEWGRRWPDAPFIRYLEIGNQETLFVNSLPAIKEVLQTHCYETVKPALLAKLLYEITGRGVFAAEGEDHKKQRRMLTSSFAIPKMRLILPVFKRKARDLSAYFDSQIGTKSSASIEVKMAFDRATLDIVGTAVLGVELNNLKSKTSELNFRDCYDRTLNQPFLSSIITFINTQIPVRAFLPIEANTGFVRATREIRTMVQDVVHERVLEAHRRAEKGVGGQENSERREEERSERDILTYMVEERLSHTRGGDGTWTEQEIVEHLLNFMAAGFETTASTLVWSAYILATNPAIQTKLRDEILDLLAHKPDPDYNDIDSLRYLNNFVREVLRLYCPVVMVHRETTVDLVLAGVPIPKGTHLYLCPPVSHHSPKIWGPDVEYFRPERWDGLIGEATNPYAFGAFINGPRICIGKHFALLEVKIMLIETVSQFKFEESAKQDLRKVEYKNPSVTLRPAGGLEIEVSRL